MRSRNPRVDDAQRSEDRAADDPEHMQAGLPDLRGFPDDCGHDAVLEITDLFLRLPFRTRRPPALLSMRLTRWKDHDSYRKSAAR